MAANKTNRRKILLIDDDNSLLVTLSDFLRYNGYDVITAESAERALDILRGMRPDIVILDMSMPGMGGRGFLECIGEPNGRLRYPVLVLTARASMAEFFAQVPVDGFIAKPCDPSDLLLEIGRIIFLRGGEAVASGALVLKQRPKLLLCEPDKTLNDSICKALNAAGYEAECLFSGKEIIESAIVSKPDGMVLRMELDGLSADLIARLLGEMPSTAHIPVVVYGVDGPGVKPENVEALEAQHARLVGSIDTRRVTKAVRDMVEGD